MEKIDAMGQKCPIPLLRAREAFGAGQRQFSVEVDNTIACENITRFAQSLGGEAKTSGSEGRFLVELNMENACDLPEATQGGYLLLCGSDTMGKGAEELGETLIAMFFFTLLQSEQLPSHICLINAGVKLAAENQQVAQHLKDLMEKGVEVLVCGTCLNYYQLTPQAGKVSNMYDILSAMQRALKVVTL